MRAARADGHGGTGRADGVGQHPTSHCPKTWARGRATGSVGAAVASIPARAPMPTSPAHATHEPCFAPPTRVAAAHGARRPRSLAQAAWLRGSLFAAVLVAGVATTASAWTAGRTSLGTASTSAGETDASPHAPAAAGLGQSRVMPYPVEMVWPTAVRYLRVDRHFTIVDRDPDAGFILFDLPVGDDGRTARGSVEIFATKDAAGRPSASVQITTDGGPVHLPHALLDGIADKLRRERGQPGAPPPKPPGPKPSQKPKQPGPDPDGPPSEPPQDPTPPSQDDGGDDSLIVDG